MATIDRPTLLSDTKLYLGSANTLSDALISNINESVILQVGDDNTKYSEVLCKSLDVCANQNKAFAAANLAGGLKRMKIGPIEDEFYEGSAVEGWNAFLATLPDLCPYLPGGGFSLYRGAGMLVSPGDEIDVNDTSNGCSTTNLGFIYS